jgi:MarR family transcriptional regulator, organic hydroperoxide resistance regulator
MSTQNRRVLHIELVRQIRRSIANAVLTNQKVADRVGLHLTDLQCINLLELLGPTTPGALAASTGLTSGGVTVMLDRLEKAGYVKRERNPNDRRSVLIQLNRKKLNTIYAFYAGINTEIEALFSDTSEAELQTVVKFYSRMNAIGVQAPPE